MGTRAATKSLRSIYQLKITLKGFRPPIWRRFLVASTVSLEDVHDNLQIVMGWTDSPMHEFSMGSDRYGVPVCLEGSRACPPEDIGGIGGYAMFLDAISDPEYPEHESMLEWIAEDIDGDFDPEYFELVEVNNLLQG